MGKPLTGSKVVVAGAGGAAHAVVFACRKAGVASVVVGNRSLPAEVVGVKLGDDETHLVAFVVQGPSCPLQPTVIRRELALRVPSFMLPAHVVILTAMPRTANGKPDRQALAARAAVLFPPQ